MGLALTGKRKTRWCLIERLHGQFSQKSLHMAQSSCAHRATQLGPHEQGSTAQENRKVASGGQCPLALYM